jgi:hypothetical protein
VIAYNYHGCGNWPARSGTLDLDLVEYLDMIRACKAPREMCDTCRLMDQNGWCCPQVQLRDIRERHTDYNLCPMLFFDRIGVSLGEFVAEDEEE